MVVYVIKITRYGYGTDPDTVDVYGVYSNLALAGRAVTMIVNEATANGDALTYVRFEEPWGYLFQLYVLEDGSKWDYGEIEIGRMTVNE